MKINVLHILEGLNNTIFVNQEVEKIAKERQAICDTCPSNSKNYVKLSEEEKKEKGNTFYSKFRPDVHCVECACNVHAKVRSLHTSCPLSKWVEVATAMEAAKIASVLDESADKLSFTP